MNKIHQKTYSFLCDRCELQPRLESDLCVYGALKKQTKRLRAGAVAFGTVNTVMKIREREKGVRSEGTVCLWGV